MKLVRMGTMELAQQQVHELCTKQQYFRAEEFLLRTQGDSDGTPQVDVFLLSFLQDDGDSGTTKRLLAFAAACLSQAAVQNLLICSVEVCLAVATS